MSLHRDDVSQLRKVIKAAIARGELLERAVEGLTDEQIESIPQLIELYTWPESPIGHAWVSADDRLRRVFPRREPQS